MFMASPHKLWANFFSTVNSNPDLNFFSCCIRRVLTHGLHHVQRHVGHHTPMVIARDGNATHGDVCVANSLDLLYAVFLYQCVKDRKDSNKTFNKLTGRYLLRELRKAHNVGK